MRRSTTPVPNEAARGRLASGVVALLLLSPWFLASFASAQESVTVTWKDGRLGVLVDAMPLAQVLLEVARQTGVEIRGLDGLDQKISARFSGLPLGDGLPRLLLNVDFVLVEEPSPQGATRPVLALIVARRAPSAPSALMTVVPPRGRADEVMIFGEVLRAEPPPPEVVILAPDGSQAGR